MVQMHTQLLPLLSKLFSMIINQFYNQGGEKALKSLGHAESLESS